MSAMKRELEERAEQLLGYLFPEAEREKWSVDEQMRWAGHAREAAAKILQIEIDAGKRIAE